MNACVILPTYNEAENIVPLVESIRATVPNEWHLHIVVIDDNSPDGTYNAVKNRFADDMAVSAILRTADRGLANSIRTGLESTNADYVIVMDTDFTHDPRELTKMLHVAKVYDLVSGSRFCAGGRMQDTRHYVASLLFNWLLRIALRTQVQDNLGGYFVANRARVMELPLDKIFSGYGDYYFRLLYFAEAADFTIVELPAQYMMRTKGQSKSSWLSMLVRYITAAVRLRMSAPRRTRPAQRD